MPGSFFLNLLIDMILYVAAHFSLVEKDQEIKMANAN